MAVIHTIEDLVKILDERPEWHEALRTRMLTRELLELPQVVAQFAAGTEHRLTALETTLAEFMASANQRLTALETTLAEFMASTNQRLTALETTLAEFMASTNQRLTALETTLAEFMASTERRLTALETTLAEFMASTNRRLTALEEGQARIENDVAALKEGQARIDNDIAALKEGQIRLEQGQVRIENDVSTLKAAHARNGALRITRRIARIANCRQIRVLEGGEILDWLNAAATAGIPQNELDSFEEADIIIEAQHRDTGEIHYIAVEVSYTAGQWDVDRAIRNAGFLTRFTGRPAHAAVAGRRARDTIMPLIARGDVYWVEIGPETLETD